MTVISSLYSGISGINSNGSALSIVGDNIANQNTVGFKSSSALFESALTQQIGEAEVGLGSALAGAVANFGQGNFSGSTRATDLAINGKGFFIVENEAGARFYTRAGAFSQDANRQLVTSAGGLTLQGFALDTSGNVAGALSAVDLSAVNSDPTATTEISFALNLDASDIAPAAFDGTTFSTAAASSNFSSSNVVYDSLGTARQITTFFRKTSTANEWEYFTLTAGSNLSNYTTTSGVTDGTVLLSRGELVFDSDGKLDTVTELVPEVTGDAYLAGTITAIEPGEMAYDPGGVSTVAVTAATDGVGIINWVGAAAIEEIDHDFGSDTGEDSTTTQFSTESFIVAFEQDGRPQGTVTSISIADDGTITGLFTNGDTRDLFKIPLASFANEEGLSRIGSNLYTETADSGVANVGEAKSGERGEIRAFALEQSNVDLATEFVKIITFQRAFQASARTITAAGELLQELVNVGR